MGEKSHILFDTVSNSDDKQDVEHVSQNKKYKEWWNGSQNGHYT